MRKAICLTIVGMMLCATGVAQSVTANQNQQIINVNVPTIEKKVYVDRYRTVYVDKPRKAHKLSAPVQLLGYLWVYPEDIGDFSSVPIEVLLNINKNRPYGRDNWRMPTPDELSILENNADQIGLGDGIYLATDHRNGILRLVATDIDYSNAVRIGNTYWAKCNFGTAIETETGRPLSYQEAVDKAPQGYRLPTEEEALNLIYSGEVLFGGSFGGRIYDDYYVSSKGHTLRFPFTETSTYNSYQSYYYGYYWVQGGKVIFWGYGAWGYREGPKLISGGNTAHARYVLDK